VKTFLSFAEHSEICHPFAAQSENLSAVGQKTTTVCSSLNTVKAVIHLLHKVKTCQLLAKKKKK